MPSPLHATIQEIQGDTAIIALEDGQTVRIPSSSVEGSISAGTRVLLMVVAPGGEDAGRQAMSRHVLNEILGAPQPPLHG
jgi:hypothetical protein